MAVVPDQLCAPTIGGGSARSGGGGGEDHRSQISFPCRPKFMKTAKKMAGFAHVLANKSPKTPFFAKKYLKSYTCSRSRRRAAKGDKRMVLVHTHGLFIT